MKTPRCRHCNRPKVNRPRGLCWTCFYTPGVRDRYEPRGFFGRCGAKGHLPASRGAKS